MPDATSAVSPRLNNSNDNAPTITAIKAPHVHGPWPLTPTLITHQIKHPLDDLYTQVARHITHIIQSYERSAYETSSKQDKHLLSLVTNELDRCANSLFDVCKTVMDQVRDDRLMNGQAFGEVLNLKSKAKHLKGLARIPAHQGAALVVANVGRQAWFDGSVWGRGRKGLRAAEHEQPRG